MRPPLPPLAVRLAYELHDDSGTWFCVYGNEVRREQMPRRGRSPRKDERGLSS
jgi:nuclear transport factor 2 (NTF2) superfamily protein